MTSSPFTLSPPLNDLRRQFNSLPEQEQRIQAVVNAGAYFCAEEALNAALAVAENAAVPGLDGTPGVTLLLEIPNSGELIEADESFRNRLRAETDQMAAEYQARKPGQ